jgi:hypothetical protein
MQLGSAELPLQQLLLQLQRFARCLAPTLMPH